MLSTKLTVAGIAIVFLLAFAAIMSVNLLFGFLERKLKETSMHTPLRIIKRIIRGLIIIGSVGYLLSKVLSTQYQQLVEEQMSLLVTISFIIILTVISASVSRALFTNAIEKVKRREGDTTKYFFYRSIVEVCIYILGFVLIMLSIPKLEGIAKTVLGGAGILAVIVGFAAQETFSNILAGILIISSKPFKLGDLIKISDEMIGTVWDISLRHTVIKDFNNQMIVIPNSVINKEKLINYDLGDARACERIEFGISYDSDIDLAKNIMQDVVERHPLSIDIRTNYDRETGIPRVVTKVIRLDDSAVVIRLWAWSYDFNSAWELRCDVIESVKKEFDKHGITIPFPQRTISYLKQDDE